MPGFVHGRDLDTAKPISKSDQVYRGVADYFE